MEILDIAGAFMLLMTGIGLGAILITFAYYIYKICKERE